MDILGLFVFSQWGICVTALNLEQRERMKDWVRGRWQCLKWKSVPGGSSANTWTFWPSQILHPQKCCLERTVQQAQVDTGSWDQKHSRICTSRWEWKTKGRQCRGPDIQRENQERRAHGNKVQERMWDEINQDAPEQSSYCWPRKNPHRI